MIMMIIFGIFLVFHFVIMAGLVPFNIVWGGRMKTRKQMLRMESVSVVIMMLAAVLVALRVGLLTFYSNMQVLKGAMWVLFALFALNTLGNLAAKTIFEKYVFGLVTLVAAFLALRLAL